MNKTLSKPARDRISAVVENARRANNRGPLPSMRAAVLRAYCEDVSEGDLLAVEPAYLAAAALSHLSWGATRKPGLAKIRVFNPNQRDDSWHSANTIVQIVNDDMPFLVDSVTMCLNEMGCGSRKTMHPILCAERNRNGRLESLRPNRPGSDGYAESYIYIEIDKVLDAEALEMITHALEETLRNVRAAVEDWQPMLAELNEQCEQIRGRAPRTPGLLNESCALIEWLAADHFTLLGFREYRLQKGRVRDRLVPVPGSGLGVLRDDAGRPANAVELTGVDQKEARAKNPIVITKARQRSMVHRSGYLDQISIKVFGKGGRATGVKRFVGLYTSLAYTEKPVEIPLVRLKVSEVIRVSGLDPKSHRGKALQHILDTFPRDDLFQISIDDLAKISFGILGLQERRQVRLFWRRDALSRYFSCFVFLPRDHYTAEVRKRIERVLLDAFKGTHIESRLTISESILARLEATIRTEQDLRGPPRTSELEDRLRDAVQSWEDRLRSVLLERLDEHTALRLRDRFAGGFPASYRDEIPLERAAEDIEKLAAVIDGNSAVEMSLGEASEARPGLLLFRVCRAGEALPLYSVVPILERMGFQVISERVYKIDVTPTAGVIQEFDLQAEGSEPADVRSLEDRFLGAFLATVEGRCDNDEFNSFVYMAGLHWREAALLRSYCKFLLQIGLPFSQAYMQQVLARYPRFPRALVDQFHALFDPDLGTRGRKKLRDGSDTTIAAVLDQVTSLDEDRILRAFLGLLNATLRTNYFQTIDDSHKDYISFKLDSRQIPELPRPRPMFEIFVFSPRVEGVHLRTSSVARGGLRWSDRREDFRTEVLGLMKAQQVKNTIIVPTGAKGGFVCKRLPDGDREAMQAEVVACYTKFVRGLLDLTDNIVDDQIVTPDRLCRRDGDDPYLVVAADKGTATFSDTANSIAADYDFWLGDAFASGGSAGYDHKKMAITARGAWESVKRHFRELGVDADNEPITVVGIGDMSGDVFGNGMLLSRHIKLVAAFNHKHIFLDPDPEPEASFEERKRLFELPRSGWDDYAKAAISAGGGVYSRQAKSIALSSAVRQMLGVTETALTPPELVRAILRMPTDLLWNGGIGTYVKAGSESHGDAGDPANESVRIDAEELRCRVVAEGGNLGLTQLGRVAFALDGGKVSTDFIDNSAGVDSSDREVNIKILLDGAIRENKLARSRRNQLLAQMTDSIAKLVLQDNYAQTEALSVVESHSVDRLGENARLIRALEQQGHLDRTLEFLPSDEQIIERRSIGKGLTRPELAVLLSYSKIALTSGLAESDVPEDAYFESDLRAYFPPRLRDRFGGPMQRHRLRREILAMRIANEVVNRMGPAFPTRAAEDTATSPARVVRAYAIARDVFDVTPIWNAIEAADNSVPPALQYELLYQISRSLRRATYSLLQRYTDDLDIETLVTAMRPDAATIVGQMLDLQASAAREQLQKKIQDLVEAGISPTLAHQVAALTRMTQTLDIIEVAGKFELDVAVTARLYFELGHRLDLDWIREKIEDLSVDGRWQAIARDTLRQNLARQHSAVLGRILATRRRETPQTALSNWLGQYGDAIARVRQVVHDMRAQESADFATLSVAIREIERLA